MAEVSTGATRGKFSIREPDFTNFVTEHEKTARASRKRQIFKCAADPALLLAIGPRGSVFRFKGQARVAADGTRKNVQIAIGGAAELTPVQALARVAELRLKLSGGAEVKGSRAARRAVREAAMAQGAESDLIKATIESVLRKGGTPQASSFEALRHATLAQCVKAYELHGFPAERTPARRAEVLANMRLAIKEAGVEDKTPDALTPTALSLAIGRIPRRIKMIGKDGAEIEDATTSGTARKRVSAIRQLYRKLIMWGVATANPADAIDRIPMPKARELFANAAETRAIWQAADRLSPVRADFLRLLILLPLRRDELAELRGRDIETSLGVLQLKIDKTRSKTKVEHRLPLVGEAARIVQRLREGRKPEDFLLQLTATDKPFDCWTAFKNEIRELSGQRWFYFHSTRKAFSTEADEHRLEEFDLIDACLNHARAGSRGGSGRNYNFAKAMPRRAELLRAWEKVIMHAVANGVWPREDETLHAPADNVIELGARKA